MIILALTLYIGLVVIMFYLLSNDTPSELISCTIIHGLQCRKICACTISYSSVYIGRHLATPTSKINCVRDRIIVSCDILSKECVTTSSYNIIGY